MSEILDRLFASLADLKGVEHSASVRAEKLVCEGRLRYPEFVFFEVSGPVEGEPEGTVRVCCDHGDEPGDTYWAVSFYPNGRFAITLEFEGSSDSRILRILGAAKEALTPKQMRKHKR